jgi:hypothetical protein
VVVGSVKERLEWTPCLLRQAAVALDLLDGGVPRRGALAQVTEQIVGEQRLPPRPCVRVGFGEHRVEVEAVAGSPGVERLGVDRPEDDGALRQRVQAAQRPVGAVEVA